LTYLPFQLVKLSRTQRVGVPSEELLDRTQDAGCRILLPFLVQMHKCASAVNAAQ
jgi:hypothetical protein